MSRLLWLVVVGGVACGDVATQQQDARIDSAPDALACTSSQLACGTCIDPMTDENHCGDCDTVCGGATSCVGGHCVEMVTSCHGIHDANPSATSGFYQLGDGTNVFCEMTSQRTYDPNLYMSPYQGGPAGFTLIADTDLVDATAQAAFIGLYNHQGGVKILATFTTGNCLIKNDATTGTADLAFGGSQLNPAQAGATVCNPAAGYTAGAIYQIHVSTPNVFLTTMAADYFTTNPPGVANIAAGNNSPALFWKVIAQ